MIWFTGDTHFGHSNIIKYCNRQFNNVEEMDNTIIDNWNKLISQNDTVYHLGDFCFPKYNSIEYYYNKLNGNKVLIYGNHDEKYLNELKKYFKLVTNMYEFKYNHINFTLCHYGMRVWNKSHYGSMMLYGHSHGTLEEIINSFDVGVDNNNFKPISINYVLSKRKEVNINGRR